jgi:hypothetical protein
MNQTPMKARLGAVRRFATAVALLAVAMVAATAAAYPKPAAVPFRWELHFKPGDLRLFTDKEDGRSYWYMTYMVTNRTGKDQIWAPQFTLFTDAGEIMVSGREVSSRVTEIIKALMRNELLEEQNEIIGDLRHGRDHAREGLVIWPANDLKVNEMSVFIRGLSGESVRVMNPVTNDDVTVYKTLQRNYIIRGNATARGSQPVELDSESWIMR